MGTLPSPMTLIVGSLGFCNDESSVVETDPIGLQSTAPGIFPDLVTRAFEPLFCKIQGN